MASSVDTRLLANGLEYYSQASLQNILDRLELGRALGRARKDQAVAILAEFLGRPEHLAAIESSMSPRHWLALAFDRLTGQPVTLYALLTRLKALGADDAEALKILDQFLALGCLVYAPGQESRSLSLTPLNYEREYILKRRVISSPSLISHARQRAQDVMPGLEPSSAPASAQRGTFSDAQREVFLSLQMIAGGQFRLTVKGTPFKNDAAKLATQVNGAAVGPAGISPARTAKAGEKPLAPEPSPRLWFLLSLLDPAGLVKNERGRWQATPAVKAFLQAPAAEQARQLYVAWQNSAFSEFRRIESLVNGYEYVFKRQPWIETEPYEYTTGDVPNLPRLRMARLAIDRVLRRVAEKDDWIAIADFAGAVWRDDPEFLVPLLRPSYYGYYWSGLDRHYDGIRRQGVDYPTSQLVVGKDWPEVEGAYVAQVMVEPLHWLGLVDLGRDADGEAVSFRLTSLGRQVLLGEDMASEPSAPSGPPLVVQPNFDMVVVEARGNFDLIARLEEFADRQSLDRAAVYRLSRESVVRGLDKGLAGTEMLLLLEESSGRPLPQNVRYSVEEWVQLYERVHLRQAATLLEADSPEEMDAWLADATLAPLIGRRLSPVVALVPLSHRDALANLLKQREGRLEMIDYARPARRVLRVESSGDIHLPVKHDEPYLRYRLSSFAEELPHEGGGERSYRITAESIKRGVASGLSADGIAAYLAAMVSESVPPDVSLRVRGWGGFYKTLRYESAIVVEMPKGVDWAEFDAVPAIAELVLRRLNHSLILVGAGKFEALRAALGERGIKLDAGLPAETFCDL